MGAQIRKQGHAMLVEMCAQHPQEPELPEDCLAVAVFLLIDVLFKISPCFPCEGAQMPLLLQRGMNTFLPVSGLLSMQWQEILPTTAGVACRGQGRMRQQDQA